MKIQKIIFISYDITYEERKIERKEKKEKKNKIKEREKMNKSIDQKI